MRISNYLNDNKIEWQQVGDELAIWCPACKKMIATGDKMLTCHVRQDTGVAVCNNCAFKFEFKSLISELGLKGDMLSIEGGEIIFGQKAEPQEEVVQEQPIVEPEPLVDTSNFRPITLQAILEILNATIKKDEDNKLVTFLCGLSAYTENAQFNVSFNAPSSTGKSHIPTEIAKLFPAKDVLELAYCSPTAFFHDVGNFDKKIDGYFVDLSRKLIIFLDQPHTQLLERLRPILSHDKKEVHLKITDKNQKHGLRTKNVIVRGYPAVVFCTAGLRVDEQESTRFFLLSPEINQDKLRLAITQRVRKEADSTAFKNWLNNLPGRTLLIERILAIKQAKIDDVLILDYDAVCQRFLDKHKMLKPRHQRDIGRLISLIKSLSLLNLWWRERDESTLIASAEDVNEAFTLWEAISESQELGISPYVYKLYQDVIEPAWKERVAETGTEKPDGLDRQDIIKKHYQVYGRMVDVVTLRMEILPMLETAGLIVQEPHPTDKRKKLVYPTAHNTTPQEQNNSGNEGGVQEIVEEMNIEEIPF